MTTKSLVLITFGVLLVESAAYGQFDVAASIGRSTAARIDRQISDSLRQGTRGFNTGSASKSGKGGAGGPKADAKPPAPAPEPPPPPPPPLSRVIAQKKLTAPSWMTGETPMGPPPPPAEPLNVDLSQIEKGMKREALLAMGKPSSKMTLFEDGHMLEVYQYRNQTLASGTVRLRDGSVSAVEARP